METKKTNLNITDKNIDLYMRMIEEVEDYAIILLDKNGFVQNWNQGAQKIKGYTATEIIGKHFSIFYFEEDLENKLPQRLITVAKETGRAGDEGWRKKKDGSKFWGSITITAIHDDNKQVIGYSKVTRDLTEKKTSDDKLVMSEELYHQMIAEVEDYAIILLDTKGIIQNWNAGAEKIKGYTADEIIGKSIELFYTATDQNDGLANKLLNTARKYGKAVQEGWRVRKDGTRFWGTIVITALHGKDGQVIGFSKVTRDLMQQKIAADKLNRYTRELEIQNRELEQFAYAASHDLQEPLRKIQTFTELIQMNLNDSEFVKSHFDKLNASARRMSALLKSLLDYSRLSKNATDESGEPAGIDLNEVLLEVREDFELLIQEKKAIITSRKLPVIDGKRTQITQLFNNLVSNSLKFTKDNPIIHIESSLVANRQVPELPEDGPHKIYHKISFQDNGIGFEQKYEKVIFSLFQRLHGKHEYAGTGIGLALCKKIMENHGGIINAVGELEKGAIFNVYFPAS